MTVLVFYLKKDFDSGMAYQSVMDYFEASKQIEYMGERVTEDGPAFMYRVTL